MKQEKRISYQAGITRRPSDFLCKDGDLAECINLTTDTEELKPVVQPSEFMDMTDFNVGKIVFVHSFGDEKRYIALNQTNGFVWGTRNDQTGKFVPGTNTAIPLPGTSGFKFTAVGKTLIVSDNKGVHYYLWQSNGYKQLPDAIPDPVFKPYIGSSARGGQAGVATDYLDVVCNSGKYLGCIGGSFPRPQITDQEAFNDLVVGLYSKNKRQVAKKKGFCIPFFVRAAVELRNGEYTKITNPVLLFPCVRENSWATYIDMVDNVLMYTQYAWLKFSQETDYSEWSDIVKGVTLFISDGVEVHDLVEDQSNRAIQDDTQDLDFVSTSLTSMVESNTSSYYNYEPHVTATGGLSLYSYYVLNRRDPQDIVNDIESSSIFYKLCDIGLKPITKQNVASYVKSNVLENLVNQQQLKVDDYYSRCRFNAEVIHAYNSRLHMANVKRSFFEGFDYFLPMDDSTLVTPADYTFYVTINTDKGKITVKHGPITTTQRQGNYFYYPDARAEKVVIVKNGSVICVRDLKEHSGLNGAYFLRGLPGTSPNVGGVVYQWNQDISDTGTAPTPSTDPTDDFPNYIIVSEVNNPFVFRSTGYHSIGNGVVVGMATQAQALGQEEHGIHPLIVFTERGLVTLKVGNDGQYTNRVDEMPREVCINPACITETDGAVFFVSKKGLMVIVGNQASCVSENMNGHPFDIADLPGLDAASLADQTLATAPWAEIITACQGTETDHTTVNGFLEFIRSEKCRIAYDYVDKRLLIVNPDFGFAYVYGMADGSICKTVLPAVIDNVVSDYPDNLLQGGAGGTVYSLYDKPREDEVDNLQMAFLLTRPMKLGGPLTVSSLRELVNVGFWDKEVVQAPMPANNETEANEAPAPGTETETETPVENEEETPISSETEGAEETEETSEDAEEPGVTPEETPTEISCVKSMVWVSDNLKKWYLMSSRFGAAAKYFRLGLFIKMLPTERLSGTIITEQERRTNNLRR